MGKFVASTWPLCGAQCSGAKTMLIEFNLDIATYVLHFVMLNEALWIKPWQYHMHGFMFYRRTGQGFTALEHGCIHREIS
jgi:hypothetical protein